MEKTFKLGRIALVLLCTVFISVILCSCKNTEPIEKNGLLLDTIVNITVYDSDNQDILDGAFNLISNYEKMLSSTLNDSDIGRINLRTDKTVKVSDETARLIEKALYFSQASNGGFDITVVGISDLWGFYETPSKPTDKDISSLLPYVGYKFVSVLNNEVTIEKTLTKIDLGAIAKGYIADKVKEYLLENGVKSAVINLGGNVLCIGSKPDGKPMHIGIKKPFYNDIIITLAITDMSVVSSGTYERYFEDNGKIYHHIFNPKTGYPYDNGLISVSIISDKSVDGDGLSTSCFAMGLDEGIKLVESYENVYGIFITDDYKIHYSNGAEKFVIDK